MVYTVVFPSLERKSHEFVVGIEAIYFIDEYIEQNAKEISELPLQPFSVSLDGPGMWAFKHFATAREAKEYIRHHECVHVCQLRPFSIDFHMHDLPFHFYLRRYSESDNESTGDNVEEESHRELMDALDGVCDHT